MYTFMTFTLFLGAYMTVSVASGGKHVVASLMFQFTLGWVLMLLYSLPSFCCSMSIFDIKFAGIVGYSTMLFIASSVGALAAIKMAESEHAKAGKVMDMHAHLVHAVLDRMVLGVRAAGEARRGAPRVRMLSPPRPHLEV